MSNLTDDIAEKVGDLTLDILLQSVNRTLTFAPWVAMQAGKLAALAKKGLLGAIDFVSYHNELERMRDSNGEVSADDLRNLRKRYGIGLQSFTVSNTDANELANLMAQKGVLFSRVDVLDKDYEMFTYPEEYMPQVLEAMKILEARRGLTTELDPELYLDSLAPEKCSVMRDLDAAKLELFRHYAREEGLLFTAIPQENKDFMVVFAREQKQKAENIMLRVGWTLSGKHGPEMYQQLNTMAKMRKKLLEDLQDPNKAMNIVSMSWPNRHIEIDEQGFTVFKGESAILRKTRDKEDFEDELFRQLEGIPDPALFSHEEFMRLDRKNKASVKEAGKKKSMSLFKENYEEEIEMNRLSELKNLVTSKMILDEENDTNFGVTDPSVSLSEFAQTEYIMDQDELDARTAELDRYKEAALFRRQYHELYDVDLRDRSVDGFIMEAEQKRKARSMDPPEQERTEADMTKEAGFEDIKL